MKIAYLANIRLPTEKAHGLQIMQMCEAFGQQPDVSLCLYVARRRNSPELKQVKDPWAHYGVTTNFEIKQVACLDLMGWLPDRIAFSIQMLTYMIMLGLRLHLQRSDIYYSRDPFTMLMLSLFVPRASLCYEVHQLSASGGQARCVRRVGTVVAITRTLTQKMRDLGAMHVITEHDGFRAARFTNPVDQASARKQLAMPASAFIVGYVGRLHTMGMDKGLDNVIAAMARLAPDRLALCLVGGPDDQAAVLKKKWSTYGLAPELFLYSGTVAADRVPLYLAAFDVCLMPQPWTEHFAYYTSALKLFEYMAAERAILATNLPGTAEVVRDHESALFVPPGDPEAMAAALLQLHNDPALRQRLAARAKSDVTGYAWDRRAARILSAISQNRTQPVLNF